MLQMLQQRRTQIEADLVISRLRAAGLHPADLRIWPHVTLAGGDLFYGIEVPEEEVEAANQIIGVGDSNVASAPTRARRWAITKIGLVLFIVALAIGMLMP